MLDEHQAMRRQIISASGDRGSVVKATGRRAVHGHLTFHRTGVVRCSLTFKPREGLA